MADDLFSFKSMTAVGAFPSSGESIPAVISSRRSMGYGFPFSLLKQTHLPVSYLIHGDQEQGPVHLQRFILFFQTSFFYGPQNPARRAFLPEPFIEFPA